MKRLREEDNAAERRLFEWRDWQWRQVRLLFLAVWPVLRSEMGEAGDDVARPIMVSALDLYFRHDVCISLKGVYGNMAFVRSAWTPTREMHDYPQLSFAHGYDALCHSLAAPFAEPVRILLKQLVTATGVTFQLVTQRGLMAALEFMRNGRRGSVLVPCQRTSASVTLEHLPPVIHYSVAQKSEFTRPCGARTV